MKTLENKIRYRIVRRKDSVFTPQDFMSFSDRDQVGRVLRKLVAKKLLIKLGYGLYARTRISSLTGNTIPEKSLPDLAKEALIKIGVSIVQASGERDYNNSNSTQVPTGRVIGVRGRVSRKIGYNGRYATLEHVA